MINNNIVANIAINISLFASEENDNGVIIDVIQRIQKILKILLQTTFQIAISLCFFSAATTDVASSGKLVHTATTVNQITDSVIPRFLANSTAQSTIHFHQIVNQASHKTINKIDFKAEISTNSSSSDDFSSFIFDIPKV